MTIRMHKKVKITVLRTEYYQELAEQYAIPNFGKCSFHQKGQVLYSDGINPVSKTEWMWNLTHQAHALGIPVFIKDDLLPIMGEAQMVQEFPPAFYRVLEEQKTWQK